MFGLAIQRSVEIKCIHSNTDIDRAQKKEKEKKRDGDIFSISSTAFRTLLMNHATVFYNPDSPMLRVYTTVLVKVCLVSGGSMVLFYSLFLSLLSSYRSPQMESVWQSPAKRN